MKKLLLATMLTAAALNVMAEETVYFSDDFEWLEPWSQAGKNGSPCDDPVALNSTNTDHTYQIITPVYEGKTAYQALLDKGYDFVFSYNPLENPSAPDVAVYLNKNYLKFCKTTNITYNGKATKPMAGIVLPSITNIPAGTEVTIAFDWCSMKQGSGTFDGTKLAVIVKNGETEKQFEMPVQTWEQNADFSWKHNSVKLANVTVDANTKLTIRPINYNWERAYNQRYFLDNIKVYSENSGIDEVVIDENAPVEYYNLQGVRVENPSKGLYIKREGSKATKVIM